MGRSVGEAPLVPTQATYLGWAEDSLRNAAHELHKAARELAHAAAEADEVNTPIERSAASLTSEPTALDRMCKHAADVGALGGEVTRFQEGVKALLEARL